MADESKDEKESAEILRDMDATLKRMLNSPPKPHKPKGEKEQPPKGKKPS